MKSLEFEVSTFVHLPGYVGRTRFRVTIPMAGVEQCPDSRSASATAVNPKLGSKTKWFLTTSMAPDELHTLLITTVPLSRSNLLGLAQHCPWRCFKIRLDHRLPKNELIFYFHMGSSLADRTWSAGLLHMDASRRPYERHASSAIISHGAQFTGSQAPLTRRSSLYSWYAVLMATIMVSRLCFRFGYFIRAT